ncbi:MAG: GH25 family lysozyme [Oryzihumus sp.]
MSTPLLRRARNRVRVLRITAATLAAIGLSGPAIAHAQVIGPDIASYQHPNGFSIDWGAAQATGGAAFAFVKATEGTGYTNPYFRGDFAAIHAKGMARGAYHFARPTLAAGSAAAQADYFVRVTGTLGARGDLPPVLDLEVTGGLKPAQLTAWVSTYLKRVKATTGRTPMIYVSPYFWTHSMGNSTAFRSYYLWLASWSSRPPTSLPGGWSRYTFWQYTNAGKVPGISGRVDLSAFNGTTAALWALAKAAPVPPPAPKPAPAPAPKPSPVPAPAPQPSPAPAPSTTYSELSRHDLVRALYQQSRSTLKPGARGAGVAAAQQVLGLPRTGTFTSSMAAPLQAWQRNHGVRAAGVLDPQTWWAMIAVTHRHHTHRDD